MSQPVQFDHMHYVPVLRWKRAEQSALSELSDDVRNFITALVEVVPDEFSSDDPETPPRVNSDLHMVAERLSSNVGQDRVFLDLGHLPASVRGLDGEHPVTIMWREAEFASLFPPTPVPVVHLSSDHSFTAAVHQVISETEVGICLRLYSPEWVTDDLSQRIEALLESIGVGPGDVDLVCDFGIVDSNGLDLMGLCAVVPHVLEWRNFICLGGAFPKDLSEFELGENLHPRWEWTSYVQQVANDPSLPRVPTFGDYTIQHAQYAEASKTLPSASIRYTSEDATLVMRGQKPTTDGSSGHKQYPAHAVMLCAHDRYCGATYSKGDEYIAGMAEHFEEIMALESGGTGGAEQWLKAGINHHITYVQRQILSEFGT